MSRGIPQIAANSTVRHFACPACRTGWTGALLAGLFPEQCVISLWEGSGGVLGYAGYRHWLGNEARPANWSIAFADPKRGLPFGDGAVALLHAADSLHRFDAGPFLDECLRVSASDGALVFPHVHLANSEPDPFFERGGTILHGLDYRQRLAVKLAATDRSAFVLSEQALFARQEARPLADEADTAHYNAFIAVLADRHGPFEVGAAVRAPDDGDRLILNPLAAIDSKGDKATFDATSLAARAAYLLKRHPVYADRLEASPPTPLSGDELRLLFWVQHAPELTLGEIRARLNLDAAAFGEIVGRLVAHEVLHAAPVGGAMASLQHFFATRRRAVALVDQQFAALWSRAAKRYGDRPLIQTEDGSAFTAGDASEVVALFAAVLAARGVGAARPLAIIAAPGAEALMAVWAGWLLGAAVAPLDPALPPHQLGEIIERVDPALVLVDAPLLAAIPGRFAKLSLAAEGVADQGAAGQGAAGHGAASLADESARHEPLDLAALPAPGEGAAAAILFTSGSTGQPRGWY